MLNRIVRYMMVVLSFLVFPGSAWSVMMPVGSAGQLTGHSGAGSAFTKQEVRTLVNEGDAEIVREGDVDAEPANVEDGGEFNIQDLLQPINEQTFEDSPVQITVNKQRQTMVFSYLDVKGERRSFTTLVSTAGGVLKIPDGKNNKRPYCASTPNYDQYFPRFRDGVDIMRNPHHASGTFDATLPWAFRLTGGIFFHQTPAPKYEAQLGQAMSGGCIRIPAKYARFVWETIKFHGGVYVRIQGPEQTPGKLENCRANLLLKALVTWTPKSPSANAPVVTAPAPRAVPAPQAPTGKLPGLY